MTSPPVTLLMDRRIRGDQSSSGSTSGLGSSVCGSSISSINDRLLNFSTASMDDYNPPIKRIKTVRDPVSHRIIEKRRRDRMNNCLAELSNLLPARYLNKGQGRIEKTEIIELATHHIKHLNALVGTTSKLCEKQCCRKSFFLGFKECGAETMRFLVESAGTNPQDNLCVQLRQHLNQQSEKFYPSPEELGVPDVNLDEEIKESFERQATMFSDSGLSDSSVLQTTLLDKSQEARLRHLFANKKAEDISEDLVSWNSCSQSRFSDYQSTMYSNENGDSELPMTSSSSDDMQSNKNKEIYKFKNNIKLRFTANEGNNQSGSSGQSDFGYSNSPPDSESCSSQKLSSSPSSESTTYANSDNSSSNGNGHSSTAGSTNGSQNSDSFKNPKTNAKKIQRCDSFAGSSDEPVIPGFALHPSATYYIPIAIPSSSLCSMLEGRLLNSSNVFHPISIPVQFSSSATSLKNINVGY